MDHRISLITLGVSDLEASAAFYEALGWTREKTKEEGIIAFNLLGQVLGLYPKENLARDMGIDVSEIGGFSGMALGYNVREKPEVAQIYAAAIAAGGRGITEPHDIFWGGHSAYIADLDGHVWEIAHNPFSPPREDGAFQWGG